MESIAVVVRRYTNFLILLIPTPLVSALFLQHPYFLFIFLNVFRSLDYGRPSVFRPSHIRPLVLSDHPTRRITSYVL